VPYNHGVPSRAALTDAAVRDLLDRAPDAVVVADRRGRIVLVNAATEALFGYTRRELLGKPVEVLVPEGLRAAHQGHRAGYVAEPRRRPMGAALRLYGRRKDGSEVPVEISLSPMPTRGGLLVTSVIRDVTDRARAEAKFRSLLESAPDAMVIVDRDGRIVLVNGQAERLFGYARAELLGQPIELLIPARFQEAHVRHRTGYAGQPRVREMGAGLELMARRKDGTEFRVEVSLSPMETEEGLWITSAIRDVTDRVRLGEELRAHRDRLEDLVARRTGELTAANAELQREIAERARAEVQLREQAHLLARERREILALNLNLEAKERFIRSVVESLRDGIAILDLERRVVGWNQALGVHSGVPLDEIRGRPFFEAFPSFRTEGLEPYLDRLYAGTEEGFALDRFPHVSRVTGPMTIDLKGSVIRGPGGGIEGVVLHLENVTERVRLEQSVQETEKLAAIGTLAAGVAHEINNPIGIMTSRIELMLEEADEAGLPASIRDDLAVLQRNAERVGRITQALTSFARPAGALKKPTDLNAVAQETLLLFEKHAMKAGLRVVRHLTPGLPLVEADVNEMQQVLLNLLNNARDALGHQGEIRVETGLAADRTGWVRLAVSDTGPGIAPDLRERIFLPFFTTKTGGTGLGLAISHRIVRDHQGVLEVTSQPGGGSTFSILLPVRPPEGAPRTTNSP
jgi:PAS domain S-box-containing protein